MTGLEIWLLAIGLAMDCFAVSIASGIISVSYTHLTLPTKA